MPDEPVYWIQVREPTNASRVVSIAADIDVGRDCDDGVLIDDAAVSRRHLRLEPTPDGLVVVDLGSANGTTVDGERIAEPRLLRPGSVVGLGETQLVVFEGHRGGDPASPEARGVALGERPSAGARRLNKTASRSIAKGAFRRPNP